MKDKGSIYISGAISGLNYENVVDKFAKAENYLSNIGYEVFNPLKNGLDEHFSWEQHMAVDIAKLMECDSIYILNDALGSRGARIEMSIAMERGMIILFEDKEFMFGRVVNTWHPTYIKTLILLLLAKAYQDEGNPLYAKRCLIESKLSPRCLDPMFMQVYLRGENSEKNPFMNQIHEVLWSYPYPPDSIYAKALKAGPDFLRGLPPTKDRSTL